MITLEEYRESFITQLREQAIVEHTDAEEQFINLSVDLLEEQEFIMDPVIFPVEIRGPRNKILAFDAYSYDEADNSLVLMISSFDNKISESSNLTNSEIDALYSKMQGFIAECVEGNIKKYCDDSDSTIPLAKEFSEKIGKSINSTEILRFKFIILTDKILSKQVKSIAKEDFLGRPVALDIWTLDRFYDTKVSDSSEIIEINTSDFGIDGIQCLKADIGDEASYDAYLGIVPGKFLADIYYNYGSKLLQGNVRAFLSVRGNVNKGIRKSILETPEKFFTFNNGIAVVARSVKFSEDGKKIVYFKDPQIINGGQTTASLANAKIKKEVKDPNMSNLFVPMKLTVLNVDDELSEEQLEQYNDMTKDISRCANSQNPVSDADFFSNHPFHVAMEKLSRSISAPVHGDSPLPTHWFYERTRGKWEQEQMKLTKAEKNRFITVHPKKQIIKKEKLAKCYNTILMHPNEVCQSSAINFKRFSPIIEKMYSENKESINEEFFKRCVCYIILFDELDAKINKSKWYHQGGDKAQIVPYTLSKFVSLIPKGKTLDWHYIWQKQSLYPDLEDELLALAHHTQDYLTGEADGGLVRTLSRRSETWSKYNTKDKYQLSETFLETLISVEEVKDQERAAKRASKFNINVEEAVEVFKLGADYWRKIYNDIVNEKFLSYGDCDFINGIANYISRNNLPTASQCKRLSKIMKKLDETDYIIPEPPKA